MHALFSPVRIGRLEAANRLVMAPMTRSRADAHGLPDLMGSGLTQQSAERALADGAADAAVFGSAFLANPDLPERFRLGAALNTPDRATFFAPPTAQGYTDYPALERAESA